jgi:putative flippase GtrA
VNEAAPSKWAFARFIVIGVSNAGIGFGVYWLGLHSPWRVRFQATLSQLVAYAIGIAWSFYWNRRWTFRSTAPAGKQALRFTLLQIGCAVSSATALGLLVDTLHYNASWCWLGVMSVITVANFGLSRYWAFR